MPTNQKSDQPTKPSPSRLCRGLRKFRRDQRGATAIEFAILAPPFLALMIMTFQTAIIFLVGQGLEAATDNSARLIRTGQSRIAKLDAVSFRDTICDQVTGIYACKDNLIVDVRTSATFSSVDLSTPLSGGELQSNGFGFDSGNGGDIVVVRAFYEWPNVTRFLSYGETPLANGNHLLVSTATFRNEPF